MPAVSLSPGVDLFYRVDDFTNPWSSTEAVIFVHGLAESGEAWRAWVPHIARHYRVFRPDLRGYGQSTAMPAEFDWSIDVPVSDLAEFARRMKLARFHLVSAKFGGTVAMRFAAVHPEMVQSLSVVSSPVSLRQSLGNRIPGWIEQVRSEGVRSWAGSTMKGRLGSELPAEALDWWTDMMSATAPSTMHGVLRTLADVDITDDLHRIECPTLVITTTGSGLGSVESVGAWQRQIPRSELVVVNSDSYHIAAADPDGCAQTVLRFLQQHRQSD